MQQAPDDPTLRAFIEGIHSIAVVGLSPHPERPSHVVSRYLQAHNFHIIPVNPGQTELLGEACFPNLDAVPERPDLVLVFRRSEEVPPIADAAIRKGSSGLWLQLGIHDEGGEAKAAEAGLFVVSNHCLMVEHRRLIASHPS